MTQPQKQSQDQSGKRILITGGSIAANALAWWLNKGNHDVTLVEQAPAFRDGGQNIDVRGPAREVLKRMNLEKQVEKLGTGEAGLAFVDENNKVIAQFDKGDFGDAGPTSELEILRGDLARLLYDQSQNSAHYYFGDKIMVIEQTEQSTQVSFQSGKTASYDLVVIAEGVGSTTRQLVFGDEVGRRYLDVYMAYFTIPKGEKDSEIARWYNAPGGRSVLLRPDQKGTTRVVLTIQTPPSGKEDLSVEQQKAFMRETFADAGWETERVLTGMDQSDDFYFDVISQVKMEQWSKGQVVVLGDAAWCVTPLGGKGASLALIGAYVLAGELSQANHLEQALQAYESIMRPYVEEIQDIPKFGPRLAQPQSRFGIAVLDALLSVAASPGIRRLTELFLSEKEDSFVLPDYPH